MNNCMNFGKKLLVVSLVGLAVCGQVSAAMFFKSDNKPDANNLALIKAVDSKNISKVKELLAKKFSIKGQNIDGNTVLHVAVIQNNIPMVELLLQQNLDVNILNESEFTPLNLAACHNHTDMVLFLLKNYKPKVHLKCNTKQTALDWAIFHENTKVIQAIALAQQGKN